MAAETKIIIKGIPPYDGEYEMDFDDAFSAREWRWIKQLSEGSLRPGNLSTDDLSDPDFAVALVVIAMRRAGKITTEEALSVADKLSDIPFDGDHITLVLPEEEDDEVPPASTIELPPLSEKSSIVNDDSSRQPTVPDGSSSRNDSDRSDESLAPTGLTRLATSLDSAPTTLTT